MGLRGETLVKVVDMAPVTDQVMTGLRRLLGEEHPTNPSLRRILTHPLLIPNPGGIVGVAEIIMDPVIVIQATVGHRTIACQDMYRPMVEEVAIMG
jgi:hypothetical protein